MGLFDDIRAFAARFVNGEGDATVDAIREADAMLAQIRARRNSIEEELRGLRSERDTLLTFDDSTGRRREIREAIDDLEEQQQGLDRVEREHATSRARLLTVRNREVLQAGAIRYSEAAAKWAEAAEALIAAGNAARKIRAEMRAGGFNSEVSLFFPEVPSAGESFVASRATVDRFETAIATSRRALDNHPTGDQKWTAPVPPQFAGRDHRNWNYQHNVPADHPSLLYAPIITPKPKPTPRPKRVPPPPPAPPPAPRELLVIGGTVPKGCVAIRFSKAGVPIPGGMLSRIGDEIAIPNLTATELLRNNAATPIEVKP
jgi:hypothetical protein